MADTEDDLSRLDALFADARQFRPEMPEALSARILADAALVQSELSGQDARLLRRPAIGADAMQRWLQFWRAVGGWPAMGGMAAACAAGLWIGLAPPDFVPDPVTFAKGAVETEVLPYESYDLAMLLDEETE